MTVHVDVVVIGGGIVGLAHAWMAARRGRKVVLLERSAAAQGASVRNFGMVWPIGQPAGELYDLAMRSRQWWLQLDSQGVVEAEQCGSIHLAHHDDELQVLSEFCQRQSHQASLLQPDQVVGMSQIANPQGLRGGMYSATELRVDPRDACSRIARWLGQEHDVDCYFQTTVSRIEDRIVYAAGARRWKGERIILCSGSDLQTLCSEILRQSRLQLCKLQMLKTVSQPTYVRPAPHIASGLTLRHYTSFRDCPSLAKVQARIRQQSPELDRYGIHVMASQRHDGEVILGDSHQFGDEITPFDSSEIDQLMLRELRKVIRLKDWTIAQRWHGTYARHPSLPVFSSRSEDGVDVFVGTGGAGMTMAFGLADQAWNRWEGECV